MYCNLQCIIYLGQFHQSFPSLKIQQRKESPLHCENLCQLKLQKQHMLWNYKAQVPWLKLLVMLKML